MFLNVNVNDAARNITSNAQLTDIKRKNISFAAGHAQTAEESARRTLSKKLEQGY